MKKSTLTLAIMALVGSGAAFAASPNVQGGVSDISGVETGKSNHILFNGNNSGIALNGAGSYIDLAGGPINGSNNAIDDHGNGAIMTPADMGLFGSLKVARMESRRIGERRRHLRQLRYQQRAPDHYAFLGPQFGGLVIGQVGANGAGSTAARRFLCQWAAACTWRMGTSGGWDTTARQHRPEHGQQ